MRTQPSSIKKPTSTSTGAGIRSRLARAERTNRINEVLVVGLRLPLLLLLFTNRR
jgi:hypothetical protein